MIEEEKQISKASTSLTSPQEFFQSSSKKPTPTIDTIKISALNSDPVSKSSLLQSSGTAMKSNIFYFQQFISTPF